jgi:hypothetical protein
MSSNQYDCIKDTKKSDFIRDLFIKYPDYYFSKSELKQKVFEAFEKPREKLFIKTEKFSKHISDAVDYALEQNNKNEYLDYAIVNKNNKKLPELGYNFNKKYFRLKEIKKPISILSERLKFYLKKTLPEYSYVDFLNTQISTNTTDCVLDSRVDKKLNIDFKFDRKISITFGFESAEMYFYTEPNFYNTDQDYDSSNIDSNIINKYNKLTQLDLEIGLREYDFSLKDAYGLYTSYTEVPKFDLDDFNKLKLKFCGELDIKYYLFNKRDWQDKTGNNSILYSSDTIEYIKYPFLIIGKLNNLIFVCRAKNKEFLFSVLTSLLNYILDDILKL